MSPSMICHVREVAMFGRRWPCSEGAHVPMLGSQRRVSTQEMKVPTLENGKYVRGTEYLP